MVSFIDPFAGHVLGVGLLARWIPKGPGTERLLVHYLHICDPDRLLADFLGLLLFCEYEGAGTA